MILCLLAAGLFLNGCSTPEATPSRSASTIAGDDGGQLGATPDGLAFDDGPDLDGGGFGLDVLRLSLRRPETYLPHELALSDQGAVILADLLYDGLTEVVGREARLRPALAKSWSANDVYTEWTFVIDTTRIDAATVAAHFQHLLLNSESPAVVPLLSDVATVEATSAGSVRFVLDKPAAGFAWLVSGLGVSIVGDDKDPTGRYLVASESEDMLELVPERGLRSSWPAIDVLFSATESEAYRALTLGLADAGVAPVDSLADAERRYDSVSPDRSISRFFGLNLDSPQLVDERLQRAVRYGIDRTTAVRAAGGSSMFLVDGVLAPSMAGYDPAPCEEACAHRPELAAELVAEVQAKSGAPVALSIAYSGDESDPVVTALLDDLEAAGFSVTVEWLSPAELAQALVEGRYDLYALGWLAAGGSIDSVLPSLLASRSTMNGLGVGSAEVDELIVEAAAIADDTERWSLLIQAERAALATGRILPIDVARSHLVTVPPAAGLVLRADGSIDMEASQ